MERAQRGGRTWWRTGDPTVRAAVFHGVFVAAVTVFKSATNALYLAREDPAGLPRLYILVAAGMALTTLSLAGPLAGRPPRWLLGRATGAFAVITALLAGTHALGLKGALGALYVVAELFGTSLSILFWSTVSAWCCPRAGWRARWWADWAHGSSPRWRGTRSRA